MIVLRRSTLIVGLSIAGALPMHAQTKPSSGAARAATAKAAPVVRRYRVDSKMLQSVDARALKGEREESTTERTVILRISFTDSAGGSSLRITVDSISNRSQPPQPMNAAIIDSIRGKVYTAFVAPDGSIARLDYPPAYGALGTAVGTLIEDLLPRVKPGYKNGDDWTTTSTRPHRVPNGELSVVRKTSYAVMGEMVREGVPATRLDMTFTSNSTGTQRMGPTTARVEGESMGSGSAFVAKNGTYLGGMRTEKAERRLKIPGVSAPILSGVEIASTITLLR